MSNVHFSSKTDMWATPQDLFDKLARCFNFTLDACATAENAKCATYLTEKEDALVCDWDKFAEGGAV